MEPTMTALVTRHCGDCHKRSVSEATPAALKAFDVDDPGWLAGIPSESFFRAFMPRLEPYVDSRTAGEVRAAIETELTRRRQGATQPANKN
jgi:hypothetical protein